MKYPFDEIEKRWQKYWEEKEVHKTDFSNSGKKLYSLVMFIYPSGAKLHCGHWYNYGPADTWTRLKKLQGFNTFEPMGYDAFGLPAENYAVKTGVHPHDSTMENIRHIRQQLKKFGAMYDWGNELMTCVPEYYKWNQWLFLQMYRKGLAYRSNAPVNWCNSCNTVLANEQVDSDGTCERCHNPVLKKNMTQWFFRITQYAEELLNDLDKIDWPEKTKLMQRNWIGKSTGTEVTFKVDGLDDEITVFTTRPDTLFGVTYVVLAPEHPLVAKLTTSQHQKTVSDYLESVKKLSEIERLSTTKEKSGVPIGSFAINPVNGEKIPIWTADYVLFTYGTGAVMAVPAHDERDFEFAAKFTLPVKKVILQDGTLEGTPLESAFTDAGTMINSGKYNGLNSDNGIEKITDDLILSGKGKRKVNYRLRDWLISRQRYWGTPIPIIHCPVCGEVEVPESQLPVELPYDVDFKPKGKSPLASNKDFISTKCPKCGGNAERDPDTMDTFVDSSWYHLRFINPSYSEGMFDFNLAEKWMPVDSYIGGAEHSTKHLIYARFIHKFLRDIGLVKNDEPYAKLRHQGLITNQGAKMSKSLNNVVNPDDFVDVHGADVFRMYLMFMGPFEAGGDWSDTGIVGVSRFVSRVYDLYNNLNDNIKNAGKKHSFNINELDGVAKNLYRKIHFALKKVPADIDALAFNTAVPTLMETINELSDIDKIQDKELVYYILERFAWLISPLAPHLGEECWRLLGKEKSLFEAPQWFEFDPAALILDRATIAIQINGKLRSTIEVPVEYSEDEVKSEARKDEKVLRNLEGKTIVKEIYVKNKILNIVVK